MMTFPKDFHWPRTYTAEFETFDMNEGEYVDLCEDREILEIEVGSETIPVLITSIEWPPPPNPLLYCMQVPALESIRITFTEIMVAT